jgi:hypothetical protein
LLYIEGYEDIRTAKNNPKKLDLLGTINPE